MSADNRRQNSFPASSAGYKGQGMANHYNQAGQTNSTAQYLPRGIPNMSPHVGEGGVQAGVHALASNMAAMNLQASYGSSAATNKSGGSGLSTTSSEYGGVHLPQGQGLWVPNQHIMGNMYHMVPGAGQQQAGMAHSPAIYNPAGHFVPQAAYPYGQALVENSPMPGWASRVTSAEMPSLMTPRRDSISSNENDVPGTPYTNNGVYRYGTATTIMDRSPSAVYTSSATPSPSQMQHSYSLVAPLPKQQSLPTLPPQLMALLTKEPPIPRAIPAPSSPLKPLDRSLENKTGETNVYIRGLLPETTDEMLHAWGARFGDIQSSKSIIDLKTNLCKGFGFIKYHNFEDAENCIRGFHYLGYEVSFARESFYAKLKKFADEKNTNLYVSGIPKKMNEHELGEVFAPYKVCSSKVLRDAQGNGRGVGFARFETREICEEVIRKFNNTPVQKPGGEEHLIQIRYSDTHEQKMLKQQTAAGRIFRAAEYEVGVAQARGGSERLLGLSPEQANAANEFEMFLQQSANPTFSQPSRYRAPWAPSVPSTLGMSRSTMSPSTQPSMVKMEKEGTPEVEMRTNPTTPIKEEGDCITPSRGSDREE